MFNDSKGDYTMKKLVSLAAAAVFGALTLSAATPVAVWDGDFTAAQTGFTLNRSGNAISQDNSTITIDQDVGVKVDFDSAMPNGMTVLFRYTNLSLDSDKTLASSFAQGSNENSTGVQLVSTSVNEETVGVPSGFYNTSTTHNTGATQNNVTSSMSSGVMAFMYTNGGGTQLYYINNNAASVVYSCSSLKSGTDFTGSKLKGCAIGGERARSGATLFPAATGMKITAIAIFNGGLTEAEMTDYEWPSDGATIIKSDTTVSAINSQVGGEAEIKLLLSPGVTITMDEAFTVTTVKLVSLGNVTLAADSQPSAEELAKLDLSGVVGAVKRSWLGPDVIGFNFNSDGRGGGSYYYGGAVNTSSALATGTWYANADTPSATSNVYADALTKLTWKAKNVYSEKSLIWGGTFIQGYLDDGDGGAKITTTGIPFEKYDVIIYCTSDSSNGLFRAKYVNGKYYTWDSEQGKTVVSTSADAPWGAAQVSTTPIYGTNAIRINGLSGQLSINGGTNAGANGRGGISAIQIIPADVEIDAANGYVPDATRLANIRKDYREVTIKGDGDNGATLNYGSTTDTFTSHIVFDGGVHSVTYNNSGTASIAFAQNASSPVFETTNGATLNLYSIDLSGWQGNAQNKVPYSNMLVGEGTMLNLVPNQGSEDRTFYYQGRFTIEPGATLKTSYTHQNSVFRLNGGAYEGYEQIYVPASELGSSHAVITGVDGNTGLRLHSDATVGVGIFVGENSALDFDIAITSAGSAPIGKWGDGTVVFNGDLSGYQGALTVHEGTVSVSTATTLASVVNEAGATIAYSYGAKPTITAYSGDGNVVVDISSLVDGGSIEPGTYVLAPASVPSYRVSVVGLPEDSGFSIAATEDGIVLTDEQIFSPEWTGPSGAWTSSVFDGRSGNTEGLAVVFSQSATPEGSVTVAVDGEKSVKSLSFMASDTGYTLKGDRITTTEGITVNGGAPVVVSNELAVSGTVALNAGTQLTLATNGVSFASGALSGAGTLVLDPGEGNEFTMSTANTSYTGEAVIASGTVKMGDAQSFGVVTKDSAIRVKGGATFDANHAEAISTYYAENGHKLGLILESGATFASSSQNNDRKLSSVSSITLEGDAMVDATAADVSIALHLNWDYTHIYLGTNTLRKTGDNTFWISACKIDGTGVFHVENGSVTICESYYGTRPGLFAEGTLRLDTGASFNMVHYYQAGKYPVFTVKNLELNGTVTRQAGTDATNSTLTVTGYITGNGTTPTLTFAEGAMLKPTGTGYLTITESLSGTVTVDVGEVDFETASSVPLFKVGSAEMLPEASDIAFSCGDLPKKWSLTRTSDKRGYVLKKFSPFTVRLR